MSMPTSRSAVDLLTGPAKTGARVLAAAVLDNP